jgi:pyruvate dehydrogenase E1 component beta subunit
MRNRNGIGAVTSYGEAIRAGFAWLMRSDPRVFAIGQGLWSPWYVGNSMTNLDVEFGRDRVLDTPVSEAACTGAAIGASLCGYRPIVVHPRVDFMLLAVDQIVNQAAKWCHMLGGRAAPRVTIRGIVNRGGEQGAQHSQALHSWFAHVPGLRVAMPATVADARDLLIASVMCDDPVLYIDDRWLYEERAELGPVVPMDLRSIRPARLRAGTDLTLVAAGYSTLLALRAADLLARQGLDAEVWDLRVINPLDLDEVVAAVGRSGRLCAIDGSWQSCGLAGEVVARACESLSPTAWRAAPMRITLPPAPAPSSRALEQLYYPTPDSIVAEITKTMVRPRARVVL